MARPKGSKSDPIGRLIVELEAKYKVVDTRIKALRESRRKMMANYRILRKMGL